MIKFDKYITCYSCVVPEKENNKYIVTYIKKIRKKIRKWKTLKKN
jgi:hypothetical protein